MKVREVHKRTVMYLRYIMNVTIYLSNIMIRFDDKNKLVEEKEFGIDGTHVELTLVKSRLNKAGKSVTLVFDQTRGFDEELSLLVLLKENKRIGGAGAHLYIEGCDQVKFAQRRFKEKLAESPEMQETLANHVIDILQGYLYDEYTPNEDELKTESTSALNNLILSKAI